MGKEKTRDMAQISKKIQEITSYLETAPLSKEGLTERKAALEQKRAERAKRLAEHAEKVVELVKKLKIDPAEERRFQQR